MFSLVCLSKRMMFAPILYLCTVLCLCCIDQSAQERHISSSVDALTDDVTEFFLHCETDALIPYWEYTEFRANDTILFGYGVNIDNRIYNSMIKQMGTTFYDVTLDNPGSRLDAVNCKIISQIDYEIYLPYLRVVDFKIAPLPDRQYYALCQTDVSRNESAFYLDKEPFEYRVSLQYQNLTLAEYYHLEDSTNLQNSTLNIYHPQYVFNGSNVGSQHSFILREREGLKYNFENFTCNLSYKNTTTKSKTVTLIEFRNQTNPCANQIVDSDYEYEYEMEETVEIIEHVDGVDGNNTTNNKNITKQEIIHEIKKMIIHEYMHRLKNNMSPDHKQIPKG